MDNFTEKFRTKSNAELMRILKDSNEYRPNAVLAAKEILESRKLNQEDIENVKKELANQWQEKEKEKQKKKEVEKKIKEIGFSFIDTINPLKSNITKTERSIRTTTVMFGLVFLYDLYSQFGILYFMFTNGFANWDYQMVLYFLPLVIIPIGIVLFHKRKRSGWIIFSVLLSVTTSLSVINLVMTFNMEPTGNSAIDRMMPSHASSLGGIIFNGCFLWLICTENIREVYTVSKNRMYSTVGLIVLLTFIIFSQLF